MTAPARLPDAASLETVLAGLDPASADADLIPALSAAFPGFAFGIVPVDDDYWRDNRAVNSSWHSAARAPWTLLAAICSPCPLPPTTMPRSAPPPTTARAQAAQNLG